MVFSIFRSRIFRSKKQKKLYPQNFFRTFKLRFRFGGYNLLTRTKTIKGDAVMKNKSHTSGKRSLKIRKLLKALQTYVCITAIILSLVLSLASCKKSTQSSDNEKYAGSTVCGKITEIDGNYVKTLLGELSGNDRNGRSMGDIGTPPERPDGENGSMGNMENPPELPGGERESNGMMRPGGASSFTAGTVTVTFDLSGVSITKSSEATDVSGLGVDDIICLSFNASGEVKSAYVVDLENGGFPGGNGGNGGSVDQGNSANTISSDGNYSCTEYISTGNNAMVVIDSGCTWNLTGDCTLTSLTNNGTINYNGYTITLANDTVLGK